MRKLSEIFRKLISPAVPPRLPIREVVQEKLKEVNEEIAQIKRCAPIKISHL